MKKKVITGIIASVVLLALLVIGVAFVVVVGNDIGNNETSAENTLYREARMELNAIPRDKWDEMIEAREKAAEAAVERKERLAAKLAIDRVKKGQELFAEYAEGALNIGEKEVALCYSPSLWGKRAYEVAYTTDGVALAVAVADNIKIGDKIIGSKIKEETGFGPLGQIKYYGLPVVSSETEVLAKN